MATVKNIIREVPAEAADFSSYFYGDCFENLYIISRDHGRIYGFRSDEYKNIKQQAENIAEAFEDMATINYTDYKAEAEYYGVKADMRTYCKLKKWYIAGARTDVSGIAEYLNITTGHAWSVLAARGYCQGDYAEVLYCEEQYDKKDAEAAGEIYLGCATEFCVIDLDENGNETDTCYGFIVADCQVNYRERDKEYKQIVCEWDGLDPEKTRIEFIDGQRTYTEYTYRAA